ncbi:hypothetical protein HBA54_20510 [Pelagibius litoralis]|uniref:P-loop containing region of AAA domain-containing protein n=1 Tax=Pelagibius litoralis TaxID=374515 RepID=A0A967F100_9PROT|nr:SbcC/MukB-like Walker B domain-containing protein [Pelagibius litoralis]NIA70986.1 hypothetical protein [Pelagibius litoralis]
MELRRITMVNWHIFDVEDIEVRGNAGILGENTSGKSTVLDMIQAVMTGASRSFMRLNAVAGDGKKVRGGKSKRSVHAYCLGTLGEHHRKRKESVTYLALGFESPDPDTPPVTIGLALEARENDPPEQILGRFVAVGALLASEDFVEPHEEGFIPSQWGDARAGIEAKVGRGRFHDHHDSAMNYVREYMRHILPGTPADEKHARSLLKAIVNSATLDQGYSATGFVRQFILEENNIEIGGLRESIRTYRDIDKTIKGLRRKLDTLYALKGCVDSYVENLDKEALESWVSVRGRYLSALAENRAHRRTIAEAEEAKVRKQAEAEGLQAGIDALQEEIDQVRHDLIVQQERSGRRNAELELGSVSKDAEVALRTVRRLRQGAAVLRSLFPTLSEHGVTCSDRVGEFLGLAASDALPSAEELAAREEEFIAEADGLAERLAVLREDVSARAGLLREEVAGLRESLERDGGHGQAAYLERDTTALIDRLRAAGMRPRPLCDLIEVNDPEWTVAAEGLLGRDREAILVDRKDILEATAIFKKGRRDFRRASLVSLNKIEPFLDGAPEPGTFPTLFDTDDPDAMAFLMRRHKNVRLAYTEHEFNLPGRAIMTDGFYDDGLIRRHRALDPNDRKIGRKAQQDTVAWKRRSLAEKAEEAEDLRKLEGFLSACIKTVRNLAGQGEDGESGRTLSAAIRQLSGLDLERQRLRDVIDAIDAEGDAGLSELKASLEADKKAKDDKLAAVNQSVTKHDHHIFAARSHLDQGEQVIGSNHSVRLARRLYAAQRRQQDLHKAVPLYQERFLRRRAAPEDVSVTDRLHVQAEAHGRVASQAEADRKTAERGRGEAETNVRLALKDYATDFGESTPGAEARIFDEVRPWVEATIENIEGNALRRYENEAQAAADKATRLFRGEFVNELSSRMEKMGRELSDLNDSLKEHPLHNEYYSFKSAKDASFDAVLRVVEIAQHSDEALDALFKSDVAPDSPYLEEIKEVERILQDDEVDFERFEDYRNYYTFELYMEDKDTGRRTKWEDRRGTGSGAEQQAPLYVAIGASLASVYDSAGRKYEERNGISIALFDEAFSTMDENNKRALMTFYEDLGLQVFIAAPMMNKADLVGYMETMVDIDRIEDDHAQASVAYHKRRAREAVVAMNPQRLSREEIAARMVEAAAD